MYLWFELFAAQPSEKIEVPTQHKLRTEDEFNESFHSLKSSNQFKTEKNLSFAMKLNTESYKFHCTAYQVLLLKKNNKKWQTFICIEANQRYVEYLNKYTRYDLFSILLSVMTLPWSSGTPRDHGQNSHILLKFGVCTETRETVTSKLCH